MSSDVLLEEFEVLESIYPNELTKTSERDIHIDAEPDDPIDGDEPIKVTLSVHYTDLYPDEVPTLSLTAVEGEAADSELEGLLSQLKTIGEENIGMAMTFTLVSHLREQLSEFVRSRAARRRAEDAEKERLALEAEEARTRGTPVTSETFKAWKAKFDKEVALKRAREEDERLRGLTAKEREEWKRVGTRLSGRQLFERNKITDEDSLMEEDAVSVDVSLYERTEIEEEEDQDRVTFSDSD